MSHKFKARQEGKGMKRKVTYFKAFERINKYMENGNTKYSKYNYTTFFFYKTFFCYVKYTVLITISAGNTM